MRRKGARMKGEPRTRPASSVVMAERRAYISRLMLAGLSVDQIAEQAAAHLKITLVQAEYTYKLVARSWMKDSGREQARDRVEAIQRLRRDLAQMRAPLPRRDRDGQVIYETVADAEGNPVLRNGKPVRRPVLAEVDWASIARHEALLSRIEGTQRPIVVQLDPRENLRLAAARLFESMTDEECDRMIAMAAEYDEHGRQVITAKQEGG